MEKQRTAHEAYAVLRTAKTFIDRFAGDFVAWHQRTALIEAVSRREKMSSSDAARYHHEVLGIAAGLEANWDSFERNVAKLPAAVAHSTKLEDFRSSVTLLRARLERVRVNLERSGATAQPLADGGPKKALGGEAGEAIGAKHHRSPA